MIVKQKNIFLDTYDKVDGIHINNLCRLVPHKGNDLRSLEKEVIHRYLSNYFNLIKKEEYVLYEMMFFLVLVISAGIFNFLEAELILVPFQIWNIIAYYNVKNTITYYSDYPPKVPSVDSYQTPHSVELQEETITVLEFFGRFNYVSFTKYS